MPRPNMEPLNIGSISRGALMELFEANALKIAQNIADTSTQAATPRTLTIKLRFKPDIDRRAVQVTASAKVDLAAIAPHESRAYIGKDDAGKVYLFDQDPRQDILFEPPVSDQNLLNFKTDKIG